MINALNHMAQTEDIEYKHNYERLALGFMYSLEKLGKEYHVKFKIEDGTYDLGIRCVQDMDGNIIWQEQTD